MSCLRRARGAGRTKPPEEHYAEAEGSSGRWTKAFPARRTPYCGRAPGSGLFLSGWPRASAEMRRSTWCEKKRSQFATSSLLGRLTASWSTPSVRLAPSTERPRLRVSPRGSRFGGGQSEDRTKASPARCISLWAETASTSRARVRLANCRLPQIARSSSRDGLTLAPGLA